MRRHAVAVLLAVMTALAAVPAALGCEPQLRGTLLTLRAGDVVRAGDAMGVFAARRRSTDLLPRDSHGRRVVARLYEAAKEEAALRGLSIDPPFGRILVDRSRLLVAAHGVQVYAAPTAVGGVCWEIPDLVDMCNVRGMSFWAAKGTSMDALDPASGPVARCYPLVVVGILPDQVRSVSVVVAGHPRAATMGRNAFVFVGSEDVRAVSSVVVRYAGGVTRVTRL